MVYKVCPKCLHLETLSRSSQFCSECGGKLKDWDLKCEGCGSPVFPIFHWGSFSPRRKPKPLFEYCPECGFNVKKSFEVYTREFQAKLG